MSVKRSYVSPRVAKLEFVFKNTITASGGEAHYSLKEGDCGYSEDTRVFIEGYEICNTWNDSSC